MSAVGFSEIPFIRLRKFLSISAQPRGAFLQLLRSSHGFYFWFVHTMNYRDWCSNVESTLQSRYKSQNIIHCQVLVAKVLFRIFASVFMKDIDRFSLQYEGNNVHLKRVSGEGKIACNYSSFLLTSTNVGCLFLPYFPSAFVFVFDVHFLQTAQSQVIFNVKMVIAWFKSVILLSFFFFACLPVVCSPFFLPSFRWCKNFMSPFSLLRWLINHNPLFCYFPDCFRIYSMHHCLITVSICVLDRGCLWVGSEPDGDVLPFSLSTLVLLLSYSFLCT